jgi:two-component system alkaline phosphatase synthesis response regulator PhoP
MLRRVDTHSSNQVSLGCILLDDDKRQVFADGVLCPLTYKEHELLKYLMANHDIVLTREKIMDKVWGMDFAGESRTVDMHIKTLRQKLGSCGNMIKTVRNVGYKIEE